MLLWKTPNQINVDIIKFVYFRVESLDKKMCLPKHVVRYKNKLTDDNNKNKNYEEEHLFIRKFCH